MWDSKFVPGIPLNNTACTALYFAFETASSVFLINSREDEFQADRLGVKYMRLAGYDPHQMKPMLAKLLDYQNKRGLQPKSYWRTHPYIPLRIAKVDIEASNKNQFKDYLNLTGEER